jgi:hypothetical protein
MFGKKKETQQQVKKEYRCSECGLDCSDQPSLERHISWAHKKTSTAPLEEKGGKI